MPGTEINSISLDKIKLFTAWHVNYEIRRKRHMFVSIPRKTWLLHNYKTGVRYIWNGLIETHLPNRKQTMGKAVYIPSYNLQNTWE